MPAQKSRRGTKRAPRRKQRSRTPVGKSVLILECDTLKLTAQGLSLADSIEATTTALSPGTHVAVVKSVSEQQLLSQLGLVAQDNSRFQIIVVVGHSSESGLRLASDRFALWGAFANWVRPFTPNQMILIACKGGQPAPASLLFAGLPTLKDLFAPPFATTKQQVQVIKALIPYLLTARSVDSDLIRLGQFANLVLTRGAIWRWSRNDFPIAGASPSRRRRSG